MSHFRTVGFYMPSQVLSDLEEPNLKSHLTVGCQQVKKNAWKYCSLDRADDFFLSLHFASGQGFILECSWVATTDRSEMMENQVRMNKI